MSTIETFPPRMKKIPVKMNKIPKIYKIHGCCSLIYTWTRDSPLRAFVFWFLLWYKTKFRPNSYHCTFFSWFANTFSATNHDFHRFLPRNVAFDTSLINEWKQWKETTRRNDRKIIEGGKHIKTSKKQMKMKRNPKNCCRIVFFFCEIVLFSSFFRRIFLLVLSFFCSK